MNTRRDPYFELLQHVVLADHPVMAAQSVVCFCVGQLSPSFKRCLRGPLTKYNRDGKADRKQLATARLGGRYTQRDDLPSENLQPLR